MPFCIRNDLWDSFSPELQQIFNDSMAAAQEYGVELVNENIELSKESLAEQGATVGTLSDEDSRRSFDAQLVASIASGMKRAKEAGVEDQMLALEKKALELYGLDEKKYLADYE
jgi:TRAP-type C4-dicarboxylate transport system substrate-binding protein